MNESGKNNKKASLEDLALLKSQLQTEREQEQARQDQIREEAQQQKKEAEQAKKEAQLFREHVKNVRPLNVPQRQLLKKRKTVRTPKADKSLSEAIQSNVLSDDWDGKHLMDSDQPNTYRKNGVSKAEMRKLTSGALVVQAQLDLHGHRTEEARIAVSEFVHACHEAGMRCVCLVHGKGLGSIHSGPVLRDKVQTWLLQIKEVLAFSPAPPKDGGDGALLLLLKTRKQIRQ
ncbi:MAG: Smr/MutS family protein [Limnobacter sp.]|nr:Smr/MutS family protein [Limnobacter sp.]